MLIAIAKIAIDYILVERLGEVWYFAFPLSLSLSLSSHSFTRSNPLEGLFIKQKQVRNSGEERAGHEVKVCKVVIS